MLDFAKFCDFLASKKLKLLLKALNFQNVLEMRIYRGLRSEKHFQSCFLKHLFLICTLHELAFYASMA